LPAEEQARLAGHLDTCVTCQRTLEVLAGGSKAWLEAAANMSPEVPAAGSAYHRAVEELKHRGVEPETILQSATSSGNGLDFLSPPEEPGHLGRLGPYEVTEEIGRGGMGVVLKAYDAPLERWVAIKVLAPHLAADETARKRFLREARAAAAVIHEHVVTIHAVGEANATPYLVMEYVPAVSLQQRLEQGQPSELAEILRIGMETAAGLAAAHARGLVHRDIKPANILLEEGTGKVKITDFGLARAVAEAGPASAGLIPAGTAWATGLSQPGVIAGTPHYMAPEQARAQAVDHRADLFSLGCVLYALCTGQAPFQGESLEAILQTVCDETPCPIRDRRPEIPAWLINMVDKLLAKNPAERYQTAAEVSAEFKKHLTIAHLQTVTPQLLKPFGYEYRSRQRVWGVPLVHIATGLDPHTGRSRVARGVIAIGNVAVGVVAIGGGAMGGIAVGGMALGLIGFGGIVLGLVLAIGGLAAGGVVVGGLAVGGIAVGGFALGYYAFGGAAWGAHALGSNVRDPQAASFFQHWLSWFFDH
jgi:serine/threonine-protein kinase